MERKAEGAGDVFWGKKITQVRHKTSLQTSECHRKGIRFCFLGAQWAELGETNENSWERDSRLGVTQTWIWKPQEGALLSEEVK